MDRLTRRAEAEGVKAVYYGKNDVFLEGEPGYAEANKLAHYEDLEESGRLVELPCKVGDTVYFPSERFPAEIDGIVINENGIYFQWIQYDRGYELTEVWDYGEFHIDDFGKTAFMTREEAEAALEGGGQDE